MLCCLQVPGTAACRANTAGSLGTVHCQHPVLWPTVTFSTKNKGKTSLHFLLLQFLVIYSESYMCALHLMGGAQARCPSPSPRGWESEHLKSSVSVVEFCFPQSHKGEFPKYRMGPRFVILERMTKIHCSVIARIVEMQV